MQDTYHGVCCVVTVGEGLAACPGHSSRCCPAAAASLPAAARRAGWAGRTPGPSSALGPRRRQARHSAVRSKLATARGSLGRETRAGAPGCSAASLGDLQSLTLCVVPRCVVVVVLSLMWSGHSGVTSVTVQSVGDGARPPGGGPLRLLALLSLNSEAAVEAGWAPHCPSLGVTRLRCGSLLLSADRGVVVTSCSLCHDADRCHAVTLVTGCVVSPRLLARY